MDTPSVSDTSVVVYAPPNANQSIGIRFDFGRHQTWTTQQQMSEALDLDVSGVSRHITNFTNERGERAKRSIAVFAIVTPDGKTRDVEHYDMTIVAYVGFRAQATERVIAFQEWAGEVLSQYVQAAQGELMPLSALLAAVQHLANIEAAQARMAVEQSKLAVKVESVEARLDKSEYMTVRQFCKLQGIQCTIALAQAWGKDAAATSRARNIKIEVNLVDGQNWPSENKYHADVLLSVCVPKPKVPFGQLRLPKGDN